MLAVSTAQADGPDISAGRLLANWKDDDPGVRMVAEVIASAFARGFSWGGDVSGKHGVLRFSRPQGRSDHERLRGVLKGQPKDGRRAVRRSDGGNAHTRVPMWGQKLVPMGNTTVEGARPASMF